MPILAPRSAASVLWGMFSTHKVNALIVMTRIMLSAMPVPPRMTLHSLESALIALLATDLQMASVFFATLITPAMPVLSTSALSAQMVPGLTTENASHAWILFTTAAGAPMQRFVIAATAVLPSSMLTDFAHNAFLGGHQLLIRLSRIASVIILSTSLTETNALNVST